MSETPLIHVVDDDESLRTSLLRLLRAAGFEARGYGSTGEFLLHPRPDHPGCVPLDLRLPGVSRIPGWLRQAGPVNVFEAFEHDTCFHQSPWIDYPSPARFATSAPG